MSFDMNRNVFAGLAAGAAGTTALNTVTYLDMVVRARPASGAGAATNCRSGLGALLGTAAGLGVGAWYGCSGRGLAASRRQTAVRLGGLADVQCGWR